MKTINKEEILEQLLLKASLFSSELIQYDINERKKIINEIITLFTPTSLDSKMEENIEKLINQIIKNNETHYEPLRTNQREKCFVLINTLRTVLSDKNIACNLFKMSAELAQEKLNTISYELNRWTPVTKDDHTMFNIINKILKKSVPREN